MEAKTYLRRDKAAAYLQERYGIGSYDALARYVVLGGGPRYQKFGKYPLYTPEDLDDWAQSRMSAPVSSSAELSVAGAASRRDASA